MCAHKHLSPRIPERLVCGKKLVLSHYWGFNLSYGKKTMRGIFALEYNRTVYDALLLLHVRVYNFQLSLVPSK